MAAITGIYKISINSLDSFRSHYGDLVADVSRIALQQILKALVSDVLYLDHNATTRQKVETSLTGLDLKVSYRTGKDDIVADFYVPSLRIATEYRRAVGYFTSSGLASAARGIASLVVRGGKMRLIASPHLEQADIDALRLGVTA